MERPVVEGMKKKSVKAGRAVLSAPAKRLGPSKLVGKFETAR
jgi:hypothetical protein